MKQFLLIVVAALIAIPSVQAFDKAMVFGAVNNSNNSEILIAKVSKKKAKKATKVTNVDKELKAAKKQAKKEYLAADKAAKKQIDEAYEKAYGKTGAKVVKKLTGYDKAMKQHDDAVKQSMKQLGY